MSAQKALQVSQTYTRGLLGGTEEKNILSDMGALISQEINEGKSMIFLPKTNQKKIESVDRPGKIQNLLFKCEKNWVNFRWWSLRPIIFQVAKAKFFRASEKEREEREREEKERSRKRKLELANITYVDTSEAANKRRKIEEAKVVDASLCAQIFIQGGQGGSPNFQSHKQKCVSSFSLLFSLILVDFYHIHTCFDHFWKILLKPLILFEIMWKHRIFFFWFFTEVLKRKWEFF